MDSVSTIVEAHRTGACQPAETVAAAFARIRAHGDPAIFISLRDEREAIGEARALAGREGPLLGVPVAIKDNMDVAGMPTTAACPAFAYRPERDATVVTRLRAAGAIVIGKTNLDQFATGLVGVRSPYGVPRNALDPALIPGGSSSGSAVAVSAGLVPLALGTDTAGSGRVPAMLNNLVGLKPSLGLVSTAGVVPACRTLDCVSVFARTTDDAWAGLAAMAGFDADDPYSRRMRIGQFGPMPPRLRVGVPRPGDRVFFADWMAAEYDNALERLRRLGADVVEIDMGPFYEAARLLYEGPWVAERYAAAERLITSAPDAMYPVTREIIAGGARPRAIDAFKAFYRLQELRAAAARIFAALDMLALPTAPAVYTVDEVLAQPIVLNSRLGTYTNFVNLLDLCALAVPMSLTVRNRPFGITLVAPAGADAALAAVGRALHAESGLPLGASSVRYARVVPLAAVAHPDEVVLAVVGAHLSGMPLNGELRDCGGRFLQEAATAPAYRLFALAVTRPAKPGLLRVAKGSGKSVALELWALPFDGFGRFTAGVPAPLSIGSITLHDGRSVKGFLVEAEATRGATDISDHGGWRAYVSCQAAE